MPTNATTRARPLIHRGLKPVQKKQRSWGSNCPHTWIPETSEPITGYEHSTQGAVRVKRRARDSGPEWFPEPLWPAEASQKPLRSFFLSRSSPEFTSEETEREFQNVDVPERHLGTHRKDPESQLADERL
jgi:hypothetical protein